MTASPSVTEKGYIDVHLAVSSPGGHSSIPPKHTVEFLTPNSLVIILTPTSCLDYRSLGDDDCGTGGKPDPSRIIEKSGSLILMPSLTLT